MKKVIITLAMLGLIAACTKEVSDSNNPFDVDDPVDTTTVKLTPGTIQSLHKNVFVVKCANPTCHDGSFEPDFRTVQSTYSSLVYQPVTKNDDNGSYTYRVHPGKADESWLMRRLTADEVLGRMPLYANPLSTQEIDEIKYWINQGAKDMEGNPPDLPNLQPTVHGYQIQDTAEVRIDTNKVNGWASATILSPSTEYAMYFYIEDDNTATADLKNQKIEFSYDRDQWSPFYQITPVKIWDKVTRASFNTASFQQNTNVYFRYYVEDEQGAGTEMPEDGSEFWFKENYSIIVQ